jgi:hypothetical protein
MAAAQLRLHELLAAFCNADGSLSTFDTMFHGVINLAKQVVHWGLSAGMSWRGTLMALFKQFASDRSALRRTCLLLMVFRWLGQFAGRILCAGQHWQRRGS